jgi:hypothetical protein
VIKALQTISTFSKQRKDLSLALMIDTSGSMLSARLIRAKYIGSETIGNLGEKDEVALFDIGGKPELLQGSTSDLELMGSILDELGQRRDGAVPRRGGNGIHVHDAVYEGARYLKTRPDEKQRVIIIVSDNLSTPINAKSKTEALHEALENNVVVAGFITMPRRIGGIVPAISLNQYVHGSVKKYAEETGGETLDIEAGADNESNRNQRLPSNRERLSQNQITQISEVIERLRSAYVLAYYLKENEPGDKDRKVKLELTEAAKARYGKVKLIYHKRYIYTGN